MNMLYRQITIHDPEYAKEKELRLSVLRKPLGLPLSPEDTQNDGDRIHLVALGRVFKFVIVIDHRACTFV
jgi:hypothetical protein